MEIGAIANSSNIDFYAERSALRQTEPSVMDGKKDMTDIAVIYEKSGVPAASVYGTYQIKTASVADTYGKYQTYLKDLGFYNGAIDGAYSDEFKKALVCFQKAYGSDYKVDQVYDVSSGISDSLKNWIQKVGAAYYTNYANGKATAAMKALGFSTSQNEEKKTFARIMTFLDKGMGCTTQQIAGVLGNIMQECAFNATATDSKGAYGILQWMNSRKDYLVHFAGTLGYDKSNIGVQLAYFKYEMSSTWGKDCKGLYAQNSNQVAGWKKLMNEAKTDYNKASDIFFEKIEEPSDDTDVIRRAYAKTIYNAIK